MDAATDRVLHLLKEKSNALHARCQHFQSEMKRVCHQMHDTKELDRVCDVYSCSLNSQEMKCITQINRFLPQNEQSQERDSSSTELANHKSPCNDKKHWSCNQCVKSYPSKAHLRLHIRRVHDKEIRYRCTHCEKGFFLKGGFIIHLRVHSGERPFSCKRCDKRFSDKANLTKHVRAVHDKIKKYECSLCAQSFSEKNALKIHGRVHTGEKPFACFICEQRFARRGCMKKHIKTVHDKIHDETYKCSFCRQGFSSVYKVKQHEYLHTREKPFACSRCTKKFSQKGNLKKHIETVHEQITRFNCSFCGKGFYSKDHVMTHERIHTGEKPFACSFCGKGFNESSGVKRHEFTHTGAKPHACSICGKRFTRIDSMKHHKLKHCRLEKVEKVASRT